MVAARPTLYRDAALADGSRPAVRKGVSILVDDGRIAWIRDTSDEGDVPEGVRIIDAGGSTIVPGMVDAHSHVTLPGGSHWIDRGFDAPDELLEVAEHNGDLLGRAGVRWARDVGSPAAEDPRDGRKQALALRVRERWRADPSRPRVRVAGTWIAHSGVLPSGLPIEADDGPALVSAAKVQLDAGGDFLKLYLDGPKKEEEAPWSAEDVRAVVEIAHGRGAKVTAHSGYLVGARVGIDAGVDSLEHGFELDSEAVAAMARQGTFLVSTLAIFRSWRSFALTTTIPRFVGDEGKARMERRRERAIESVQLAHRAGVRIAAGTDFGGGSLRANHLAWEVEALVEAGLRPWEALASATVRGGELLGELEAGCIVEGGPSDFFLVHGDPLTDPTALWRVWRVAWLPEKDNRVGAVA
jgi:imidazolonepropionase-like amidohydrolase